MKAKLIIIISAVILIVIFAVQNTEVVNIHLYFWNISLPSALLIFICIAIGTLLGFLASSFSKKDKAIPYEENRSAESQSTVE